MAIRTDLAVEALEQSGIPDGVHAREYTAEGYTVSQVEVHRDGAVPGRRAGRYLTLGLGALIRREEAGGAEGHGTGRGTGQPCDHTGRSRAAVL